MNYTDHLQGQTATERKRHEAQSMGQHLKLMLEQNKVKLQACNHHDSSSLWTSSLLKLTMQDFSIGLITIGMFLMLQIH